MVASTGERLACLVLAARFSEGGTDGSLPTLVAPAATLLARQVPRHRGRLGDSTFSLASPCRRSDSFTPIPLHARTLAIAPVQPSQGCSTASSSWDTAVRSVPVCRVQCASSLLLYFVSVFPRKFAFPVAELSGFALWFCGRGFAMLPDGDLSINNNNNNNTITSD